MPLAEHLRELRNRLAKAMLAIVVVTVVAAFFYNDIINFFTKPVLDSVGCPKTLRRAGEDARRRPPARRSPSMACSRPFTLALKVSLMAGVVSRLAGLALPALGIRRARPAQEREEVRATRSSATGVPLFLGGAFFAYKVLPTTAKVLIEFTPIGVGNLLPLDDLLDLVTRMVIVFGLSFELPLLLVMLNLTGILTGRRMLGWWRGMIMGITVFAAVATPSTDPLTMMALAGPIWILYFAAAGFSLLNDRRRRRVARPRARTTTRPPSSTSRPRTSARSSPCRRTARCPAQADSERTTGSTATTT